MVCTGLPSIARKGADTFYEVRSKWLELYKSWAAHAALDCMQQAVHCIVVALMLFNSRCCTDLECSDRKLPKGMSTNLL